MPSRRLGPAAILGAAALGLTLAGCGSAELVGKATSPELPPATGTTPTTPVITTPPPATTPTTPAVPAAGTWTVGAPVNLDPKGKGRGAATIVFPGVDGTAVYTSPVGDRTRVTGINAAGSLVRSATFPWKPVAGPAFDGKGHGVIAVTAASAAGNESRYEGRPAQLSWAPVETSGAVGALQILSQRAEGATFAADATGNAVLAWAELGPAASATSARTISVRAVVQAHSQPFGAPVTIGEFRTVSSRDYAGLLTASVGVGGRLLIAGQVRGRIEAWLGNVDGGFAKAMRLGSARDTGETFTSALASTGRGFVAWGSQNSSGEVVSPYLVQAVAIAPKATHAGPVQTVDRGERQFPFGPPILVANPHGTALLAWSGVAPAGFPVRVSVSSRSGTFGRGQRLTRSGAVTGAAVRPDGAAVIAWSAGAGGFHAAARSPGGTKFGPVEDVPAPFPVGGPAPVFAPDRSVVLPFTAYDVPGSPPGEALRLVTRPSP